MTSFHRLLAFAISVSATAAFAAPSIFDFKDPKGVNNIQFRVDAPLESTSGQATGISGTVSFDPEAPAATTGRIVLDASSLTVGNSMMKEHLHGPMWLDAAKFPEIIFQVKSLDHAVTTAGTTKAEVTGVLTLKGVAKEITVPVTLTYLPDKLGARFGKPEMKGDLLVLRAQFAINRSDFGIQPGQYLDKVSDRIDLTLSLAGAAAK